MKVGGERALADGEGRHFVVALALSLGPSPASGRGEKTGDVFL